VTTTSVMPAACSARLNVAMGMVLLAVADARDS
jgi:hypothetical protein